MDLNQMHDRAMDLAAQADQAGFAGDANKAAEALRQAYLLERQVADSIADRENYEPSRSVVHRSAAWLAVQNGRFQEAIELARRGLTAHSPAAIAGELEEVLRTALLEAGREAAAAFDKEIAPMAQNEPDRAL
ncbi:MAG: hypothetical protein GC160_13145 [Acidobacteria bacterium]|nr:hypothetical protein [Acidobacteriota bacterium]